MTERALEIKTWTERILRPAAAAVLTCALLAACGSNDAALVTPTPFPTAVPTSTPQVGFAVVVTPVGRPRATPTAAATPTKFVIPSGPYIELIPSTGPPASQHLVVRGGHLPPSVGVQVGWSKDGKSAPVTTAAGTDKTGKLLTQFVVPASPPGTYHVLLLINGARYASAPYFVASKAVLTVNDAATGDGERLSVHGFGFLPHLHLLLVAYPTDITGKPLVVGTVRTGRHGKFRYAHTVPHLALGQYVLRAWSNDALAAEMAEAYFQVVI